jgi:hypothetical protein
VTVDDLLQMQLDAINAVREVLHGPGPAPKTAAADVDNLIDFAAAKAIRRWPSSGGPRPATW